MAAQGAFILGCAGPRLSQDEAAFFRAADPLGFILFARNVETPDQLRRLTANGDTVVSWEDLYGHTCGMLCGFSDEVSEAAGELFREGAIKAFGEGGAGVALAGDYQAESAIWEWVQSAERREETNHETT